MIQVGGVKVLNFKLGLTIMISQPINVSDTSTTAMNLSNIFAPKARRLGSFQYIVLLINITHAIGEGQWIIVSTSTNLFPKNP